MAVTAKDLALINRYATKILGEKYNSSPFDWDIRKNESFLNTLPPPKMKKLKTIPISPYKNSPFLNNISFSSLSLKKAPERCDMPAHTAIDFKANHYTQKAKGVSRLRFYTRGYTIGLESIHNSIIIPSSEVRTKVVFPLFARPCPTRPRHGFVDSRRVDSWEEVMSLLMEAMKEDEEHQAEIILMPQATGKNSGVVVFNNVSWGRGNDGVTAGNSSISIPTFGNETHWKHYWEQVSFNRWISDSSQHKEFYDMIPNSLYVEFVEDQGTTKVVQLRDGPTPPDNGIVNMIPKTMTVKDIITCDYDINLLQWEKNVKGYAGMEGVVVYAPNMAFSSHPLVHALQHNLPIITQGKKPKVGDVLEETKVVKPTLTHTSFLQIKSSVEKEFIRSTFVEENNLFMEKRNKIFPIEVQRHLASEISSNAAQVATAISTVQTESIWGNESHLNALRGIAVARLVRLAMAACVGELRHMKHSRRTPISIFEMATERLPRDYIQSHYLLYGTLKEAIELLPSIIEDFEEENLSPLMKPYWLKTHDEQVAYTKENKEGIVEDDELCDCDDCVTWKNNNTTTGEYPAWGEGSYGGDAWANVARAALKMSKALQTFLNTPNQANWSETIIQANTFIHQSHNGGKILTKWITEDNMTDLTQNPNLGLMNQDVASIVFNNTTL